MNAQIYAMRDRRPPVATTPRRFLIEIRRPNGTSERRVAVGGSSVGHTADAIETAGEGARISVRCLPA